MSEADAQQAPAYRGLPPPPPFYIWTGLGGGWADLGVGDTGTGFHFDFGGDSGTFITGNSVTLNTVKAGINYRFGGPGGPSPF